MTTTQGEVEKIYIRQAAELLNRRMATLRKWEQNNVLPEHLRPHRGYRDWRYWTPDQIEGIKQWIRDTRRIPGKGLPHYNPTEKQLEKAVETMRKPRRRCVICEQQLRKGETWLMLRGKAVHTECLGVESNGDGDVPSDAPETIAEETAPATQAK